MISLPQLVPILSVSCMFFTRYNRPEGSMLSGQNPPRGPVSITVCLSESHRFMFEQRWISLSFLFLLVSRRMVQTKPRVPAEARCKGGADNRMKYRFEWKLLSVPETSAG